MVLVLKAAIVNYEEMLIMIVETYEQRCYWLAYVSPVLLKIRLRIRKEAFKLERNKENFTDESNI